MHVAFDTLSVKLQQSTVLGDKSDDGAGSGALARAAFADYSERAAGVDAHIDVDERANRLPDRRAEQDPLLSLTSVELSETLGVEYGNIAFLGGFLGAFEPVPPDVGPHVLMVQALRQVLSPRFHHGGSAGGAGFLSKEASRREEALVGPLGLSIEYHARNTAELVLDSVVSRRLGHAGQQSRSVGVAWIVEQLMDSGLLDNLACVHHRDAIGDPGNYAEIMADEEDARVDTVLELDDQVENGGLGGYVESGSRLIP